MAILAALMGALTLGAADVQDDELIDCANAGNTIELNICAGRDVAALQENLRFYTDAAYAVIRENGDNDPEQIIAEIAEGERLWHAYVQAACGAVYTQWQQGTIRTVMAASCRMELISERTHYIWREFLAPMDGIARLPEPQRSRFDEGGEVSP